MREAEYRHWWQLHARVARGEPLSPEEQPLYDAGCRELEEGETLQPLKEAKQLREQWHKLETERARLEEQRRQLDAEIAMLETNLAPQLREPLGVEK